MFEYLMPALWMHTYAGTLLDRSRHAAVLAQQEFTAPRRIPWGISESAYAARDEAGNYQYYAFGIPQLALHRGDVESLVELLRPESHSGPLERITLERILWERIVQVFTDHRRLDQHLPVVDQRRHHCIRIKLEVLGLLRVAGAQPRRRGNALRHRARGGGRAVTPNAMHARTQPIARSIRQPKGR